jgi:SSS family solute:Na+ symporter
MANATNFTNSVYELTVFGFTIPCYSAVSALVLNIAVVLAGSALLRGRGEHPARAIVEAAE